MSEFQLYDFRKIDKPFSSDEKKRVQGLSSHISVSSNRAVVSYSYGDFKHDEEKIVAELFDALLYQTNWGQKKLVLKFPQDSVNYKQLSEYAIDMGHITGYTTEIKVWKSLDSVLLNIEYCDDDFEDWVEENDNTLDSLLGLRTDIMNGDFSCLYAFWLKLLSMEENSEEEEDDDEYISKLPPLPIGLAKIASPLKAFLDFYEIDADLVKAAGSFVHTTPTTKKDFRSDIANMADEDKNDWLERLLNGEVLLDIKLKKALSNAKNEEENLVLSFETIYDKMLKLAK